MRKDKERLITFLLQIIDLFLVTFAFFATSQALALFCPVSYGDIMMAHNSTYLIPVAIVGYFLSFIFFGCYKSFRNQTYAQVVSKTFLGVFGGLIGLIFIVFNLEIISVGRDAVYFHAGISLLFLALSRTIAYYLVSCMRKKGYDASRVLIVGSKIRALEIIGAIKNHPEAGYDVIGCVEDSDEAIGETVLDDIKIIGSLANNFRDILMDENVDELVFAMPLTEISNGREYIAFAEEIGVNIRVLPDWQLHKMSYRPETASVYYEQFIGLPTLAMTSVSQKETELFVKVAMDYIGAILALLLFSPIMLLTALLHKLTSSGSVIFTQTRCGLNGRRFKVYKFRTMQEDAEEMKEILYLQNEQDGHAFKMKNDPRVTPLGWVLRKTSIDELPQLINVLNGDMSLVGPRPAIPEEVAQYKPWHRRRLSMKPGITGMWQATARNTIDFDTWMRLDLEFIDNWSILLDVKILLLTIPAVLKMTGC